MAEDHHLELAPLAALDTLDGDERAEFAAHLEGCAACRRELDEHRAVAARLGLALEPRAPRATLASELFERLQIRRSGATAARSTAARWRGRLIPALATAAAALLAAGLVVARQEAVRARQTVARRDAELATLRTELVATRARLREESGLHRLLAHPDARLARLAGLPAAPGATARVVWNATSREAWLLASGLEPPPPGKGYEVWVIGSGAPVPAGVFTRVDAQGRVAFRLPEVAETARVRTFAVTLEPAEGRPAPSGPMVLAGSAS